MEQFNVAHLNLPGTRGLRVNVIVVFMNERFEDKTESEKNDFYDVVQQGARSVHLEGNVVLVWLDRSRRMQFIAPPTQHDFFRVVRYEHLVAWVNKSLVFG